MAQKRLEHFGSDGQQLFDSVGFGERRGQLRCRGIELLQFGNINRRDLNGQQNHADDYLGESG